MTITELKKHIETLMVDMRNDFDHFYSNEFLHLRKKVDWIFVFMLVSAVATIGTLVTVICRGLID